MQKETFSWDVFKELWIENNFTRLQETILNRDKKRSETNSYYVYLRQCYYEVLSIIFFHSLN